MNKDTISFNVCHPEVFNTYINIQWCVSQTQQHFIMFIIVLGQHVSILTESSSENGSLLKMFNDALWDPKRLHSW